MLFSVTSLATRNFEHLRSTDSHIQKQIYMKFPFKYTRAQLEVFRFSFCLLAPIGVMYYIGTDTDRKLNVPGFYPDPETLNQVPKEPYEIRAELARMRKERLEKRLRLEKKLKEQGIDIEAEKEQIRRELQEEAQQ